MGVLGIVGVGIYNGKTRAATADGATVTVSSGSSINYGYYEDGGYAWETTHFTVAGQSGMCLEPNLSTANGSGTAHKLDRNDYQEMIQVMLVTDSSYNSTVYNAFKAAYPNIWANIAAKDLGGSGISGAGYANQAFVYGHAILGAMFKGEFQPAYYSETYFALNYWDGYHEVDLTSDLNSARSTIKKWFKSNYSTTYTNYQPYYMNIGTGTQAIGWLEPETAQVRVRKVDDGGNVLTGAKFTLYKVVDGEYLKVQSGITTGDNGYSGFITVEPGYAYCFSETTTPAGYVTAEDGCTSVLAADGKATVKMTNTTEIVTAAGIKINKRDADHNNTTPSGGGILDGAKFRVYSVPLSDFETACGTDAKCTVGEMSPAADGRFTKTYTIAEGDTSVSTGKVLDAGAYCVAETAVGTGYIKNTDIQCAKIDEGSTATVSFTFKNTIKKGGVKIKKTKTISGETSAMEGVTFTITSACDSSFSLTLGPTDANGEATTSATALPYCTKAQGGYTLHEETTAGVNEGYVLAGDKTFAITTNNKIVTVDTAGNDLTFNNTMSTPTMTSAATASDGTKTVSISDSVTISDKVTLKKLTSGQTYRVRGRVRESVSKAAVGSEQVSQWTQGTGTSATRTLTFSGLDVGSYVGKKLSVALTLEVQNGSEWTTVITHNSGLTEASQTVTVESQSLSSKAAAKSPVDGDKLAVGNVTVVDTVTVKGLAEGTSYKIYAAVYDGSGSTKLGEKEESYTMSASTGTNVDVPVEITFDSTDSFGGSVAVYVELRDTSGNVLAKHNEDFSDTNQKVSVTTPKIGTTATGLNDGKTIAQGSMTIKDVVSYEGLVANHSYILVGSVNLVHNGTVTKIGEDKEVTVTATGYSGTFPAIEFTFDASSFQDGDKVVVYEKLMDTNKTYNLASHENPDDEGQTVTVQGVDLRTTATVGGNKTTGVGGVVTISDTIQMEGLVVGTSYQLRGWLTDASGAKIGDEVTKSFDATAENMSQAVEFVVNTDDYIGKAVTVFEELYINGQATPIATHKTTGDTEQTVTIKTPTVGTTATETGSTSHDLNVGNVSVTDRIVYDGLIAGEKYTLVGTMMVKTDNGVEALKINGQEVRVTSPEFTAGTDGAGSYDMVFEFSTLDIQGKDLVVYEKLLHSGKEIANHEDPSDTGQTLKVKTASMGTKAVDGNESGSAADDVIEPEAAQKIKDTVSYFGLTPGKEYTLSGRLMDKSTGEVLKIDGTSVETKTMKFTAGADGSGEVVMTFELNATTLPGAEIVVFEKIIDVETTILTHEDIDDENQHILVRPRIGTEAVDEYDGNHFVGVGEVDVVDTVKDEG
ncbi:VaFE repeat-containing surface-anchored protein [Candidatus Saccharibacteria bacterium]|nr:VaFE repeat-containing surface-anchored protein [Candidatus Saccharibacteria bacterium]